MTLPLPKEYPTAVVVNQEPYVALFDDYLSSLEIDTLKVMARAQFKQALVSGAAGGVASAGRSGRNCWITHHANRVVSGLSVRVSKLVGIPLSHAESLQMIHYEPIQEYAAHFAAWDPETERGQRCTKKGGQRLVTCLLYLNDVDTGGATGFPALGFDVAARRGRMVMFTIVTQALIKGIRIACTGAYPCSAARNGPATYGLGKVLFSPSPTLKRGSNVVSVTFEFAA